VSQVVDCINNLDALPAMDAGCVDAIVTDPPYGLAFMGKAWDKTLPDPQTWVEALRVLKPGGHALIFGAPRLYHRLACAVEDAGFEIRDVLMWMFGSGFPKSLNVSKAIAAPATPEAAAWAGWGTALKPAYEPILLVRKPLIGTVAQNVLTHGTGGINVDACRVDGAKPATTRGAGGQHGFYSGGAQGRIEDDGRGRWPANVIMDEEAGAILDEQSGIRTTHSGIVKSHHAAMGYSGSAGFAGERQVRADSGGASRFFYCPKASRSEREAGLEATDGQRANAHPTVKPIALMEWLVRLVTPPGGLVLDPFCGSGSTGVACARLGVRFLGLELDPDYAAIARRRIEHARGLL